MGAFKNFKLNPKPDNDSPFSYSNKRKVLNNYFSVNKKHYSEQYDTSLASNSHHDAAMIDPIDVIMTDAAPLEDATIASTDSTIDDDDMNEDAVSEEEEFYVESAFNDFFADEEIRVDWDEVHASKPYLPEGLELEASDVDDEEDDEEGENMLTESNTFDSNSNNQTSDKGMHKNKIHPFVKKKIYYYEYDY